MAKEKEQREMIEQLDPDLWRCVAGGNGSCIDPLG